MVNVSFDSHIPSSYLIKFYNQLNIYFIVCVFLSNGVCVCVDVEHGPNTNAATILKTLVDTEDLRLPPTAMDVFALWMISSDLGKIYFF